MTLYDLTLVIDDEQQMVVCVQNHVGTELCRVRGDQCSISNMLSTKIIDCDVCCISSRDENTIWVWVEEDPKDEDT